MSALENIRHEWRPLLALAWPLVIAEIGWNVMGIVDTIMVGRLPDSAAAIGAVSLGSILFVTCAVFGGCLLLGLDTVVSQAHGAGRMADCHRALWSALYLCAAVTPALMMVNAAMRAFPCGRLPSCVVERSLPVRGGDARVDDGKRGHGRRSAALRGKPQGPAASHRLYPDLELGHVAADAVLRAPALPAGHRRGQAGDVRARLGEPGQPVWELGADLWPLGLPRHGHGWVGLGHRRRARLYGGCADLLHALLRSRTALGIVSRPAGAGLAGPCQAAETRHPRRHASRVGDRGLRIGHRLDCPAGPRLAGRPPD